MLQLLEAFQHSLFYTIILGFFAIYPLATAIMWITTTQFFRARWENDDDPPALAADGQPVPRVSVVIPAFNESAVIEQTLRAACGIQYPDYEIVVVDDGSSDDTCDKVQPFVERGQVRLVRKRVNEGKAMGLNDALPCLNGDIILVLDADAEPEPDLLQHIVPHFRAARTAAVTGNPRVKNTDTFLARLQTIEFTSIVSLLRRSQRIWGRIQTVSGVVFAVRRAALIDVGGFSPDMSTEDIERPGNCRNASGTCATSREASSG